MFFTEKANQDFFCKLHDIINMKIKLALKALYQIFFF